VTDLTQILLALVDGQVDFVLVGGLAAVSQGAPVTTFDVDIVHDRSPANVGRLVIVLACLGARYRGRSDDLRPTAETLESPGRQLLATSLGPLDVLGTVEDVLGTVEDGLGTVEDGLGFAELEQHTVCLDVDGRHVRVLRLEKLLELKRRWSDAESRLRAEILARTLDARRGSGEKD
jgi:hypothetical protein